jgi:hypothetical protein
MPTVNPKDNLLSKKYIHLGYKHLALGNKSMEKEVFSFGRFLSSSG